MPNIMERALGLESMARQFDFPTPQIHLLHFISHVIQKTF